MTCPGDIELSRALATGGGPELAAHLAACPTCRAAWDGARAAIEAARELPVALPPPERREEVRTAVLAAAAGLAHRPARRAWHVAAIAGAAAACAAGYLAISRAPAPPAAVHHAHGIVRPHAGARYSVGAIGPDEIVRLGDGIVDVEVEPLRPGERFRVEVGGAELEVRGTAFRVTARAEYLVEVAVTRGRVDLRPEVGAPVTLAAGQSWHAGAAAEAPPVAERAPAAPTPPPPPKTSSSTRVQPPARATRIAAPPRPAPPAPTASSRPSPRRPPELASAPRPPRITAAARRDPGWPVAASVAASGSAAGSVVELRAAAESPAASSPAAPAAASPAGRAPEEVSYDEAWAALRSGEFPRAARGFARVVLLAPDSPLVEDASFWRAVALARSKRGVEAVAAFHDFLGGHARSARAGEASAMLGWLLVDAGALDEAARRFDAAAGDPDPAVRRSARAGLDALHGHR